ncbi:Tetrathionate reductase subunit A [Edwardsiella anguillarum]|nr:hypothetical protein [Edwardsiella anguillarum]GAJ68798.1 tetrathionate reductase subunit A [Edwardsiella piscicida]BET80837.1 Tetrathionate reductase subunit A [Edwardsiella anguillarum]BET84126.1 Tetrathionate reductase subunit A [Edwardsiella anguillarum]BET87492.1 Tetrathionate reductase subunit A [Edwardsiella anguillarum]BET90919.1 Tetrathionate reductase subunit A [Edwardsiella anguillarum]
MDKRRRHLLKLGLAAGGGAVFAAGYASTVRHAARGVTQGSAGEPTRSAQFGNALQPELRIDGVGRLTINPQQRLANGMCFGCWTLCGVRLGIDNNSKRILRIGGNPYHPLSQQQQIPYVTPLAQAWRRPGAPWRAVRPPARAVTPCWRSARVLTVSRSR